MVRPTGLGSLLVGGAAIVGTILHNAPATAAFLQTPQAPCLHVRHRVVAQSRPVPRTSAVRPAPWGLRAVDTDELEKQQVEAAAKPLTEAEKLQLKAEMLRLQAEKLRLEADRDQIKMEREALQKKQQATQERDRLITKFREAQSEEQLKELVRVYQRQIDGDVIMRFRELGAATEAPEQRLAYRNLSDRVLNLLELLDMPRAKEVRDDVAYRLRAEAKEEEANNPMAAFDQFSGVQDSMRNQTLISIDQLTQEMMRNNSRGFSPIYAINLPQWLPREFMRMLESFEPLGEDDVRTLRTEVFKMDTFFVTDVDRTPLAVAYMGTLRKDSEAVFNAVTKRLEATEGLRDRVQLFLFENPRPQMQEGMMEGEPEQEIMFMAVSSRVKPLAVGGGQVTLSVLSALATAFNCFIYSILTFYTPADIVNKLTADPLARLSDALPIAAGLVGIQIAHDIAHSVAASARNVTLGVPIYVPSLQIGTFGSILRFASFPKSRTDMFDVAMAGPLVGTLLSFVAYAVGMGLTQGAPADVSASWPMLPVALFRSSLLLWQVGQALFSPDVVNLPLATQIHVHPLAIIGAMGLLAQALQVMPIGRLDGGRATTSVFGRKAATFLSASLVLYQVVSGVLLGNTLQLFWGTVVIIFQNAQEMYARDEITPVDDRRRLLLLGLWAIAFLVLLPGVPWKDAGFDDLSMYI